MPSKETLQKAFERLVEKFLRDMDPDIPMGINPPPGMILDDISTYDGTAGIDNRPDFVREDDDQWSGKHGRT